MRHVNGIAKPIFWFDIDDVIFHLWPDLIKYYNLEYWTKKTLKDNLSLESDKAYYVVEKYNLFENMMPTSILSFLKQKRKDIYLLMITSREDRYVDNTMWELYNHWLDFDDIFMWEKKSEVCKSEKVDYFFDDALHNVVDVQENSPNTKSHLVERDWNGPEEIERLKANWILVSEGIKRLTEKEVCDVLDQVLRK